MPGVVVDDHLLRRLLSGGAPARLIDLAETGLATTGLWYFRLCSAFRTPGPLGRLAAAFPGLSDLGRARLRAALLELRPDVELLSLRDLAWTMAEVRAHHRAEGRPLSTLSAEALAAAHRLDAAIAVSERDVGPNLHAAAVADGVPFHIL